MQADKFQNKKKFIIKDAISFLARDTKDIGRMKHKLIYISNNKYCPRFNTKVKKMPWVPPFPLFQLSCTVGNSMNMKEVASFIPNKVRIML